MKENKYMEENRYRVDRRILLFDGQVVDDERAMWFAQSSLSNIESAISNVLRYYNLEKISDVGKDGRKTGRLRHVLRSKLLDFKRKFFKVLFKYLFLGGKAPSPDHVVCLYIKYDVEFTTDTVISGHAQPYIDKLVEDTLNHFAGRF